LICGSAALGFRSDFQPGGLGFPSSAPRADQGTLPHHIGIALGELGRDETVGNGAQVLQVERGDFVGAQHPLQERCHLVCVREGASEEWIVRK